MLAHANRKDSRHQTALRHIAAWVRRETGQDLIEYGLLAVLIAVVVAVALPTLGGVVRDYYETIWTAVRDAGM